MDDKENKEPRAKKARTDSRNNLKDKTSSLIKNCDEKENILSLKYSSSMKDAVKTECRLCRQAVTLTAMRQG